MGPTQQLHSSTCKVDCASESESPAVQVNKNDKTDLPSRNWGEVRKWNLSDVLDASQLISVKSTIDKLGELSLPVEIVQYRKLWIEGAMPEKFQGLPISIEDENAKETSLCILLERTSHITLQDWLTERSEKCLFRSQVICIVMQLLSALRFLLENDITLIDYIKFSDIFVVSDASVETLPKLKLNCVNVEKVLRHDPKNETVNYNKIVHKFLGDLSTLFVQSNIHLIESALFRKLAAIMENEITVSAIDNFLAETSSLKMTHFDSILLNISEPAKNFVGRTDELSNLTEFVSGKKPPCGDSQKNNFIVICGHSGSGKSELVWQMTKNLDLQEDKPFNIIALNAASADSLTTSIYACATSSRMQIATEDYTTNPKSPKDIFQTMLTALSKLNFLIVFDNVKLPFEELVDLLNTFVQHKNSEFSTFQSTVILIMEELWKNNSIVDTSTQVIKLNNLSLQNATTFFKTALSLKEDSDMELLELSELLQSSSTSLQIAVSCIKTVKSLNNPKDLQGLLLHWKERGQSDPILGGAGDQEFWIVYVALSNILKGLQDNERTLLMKILQVLEHTSESCGISISFLSELVLPTPSLDASSSIKLIIAQLQQFSLISRRDGLIFISVWMQNALAKAKGILIGDHWRPETIDLELLSTLKSHLDSTQDKAVCAKLKEVLPAAMKMWIGIAKDNVILAKQFDRLPEALAKYYSSTHNRNIEPITGFLKEASDTLKIAYGNPYELQILKLKFLLAVESFLRRSRTNEAFLIFKIISEQSRTEPREFLMLKLKSLIELGKVHITRQEYDKAISCFQQVQIFAVQKISTIELDSEPTVLHARMLHGYAHFLQGNLVEAKKILLESVSLLERYSGAEVTQVKMFLLQAKFYLACLLRKSGDLINALMIQTKVLEEKERRFGNKHPDTWASKQEMAMLYSSYDNHERALQILRELLDLQEEVLGAPSNRQSLTTMNSIAEIEFKLGNFDDALELYEAIDLIEQEVLPEQDELRVSTQLNQAEVLMSLGQYKEAVDIFDLIYTLRSTSEDKSARNVQQCEEIQSKREKVGRSMEILGNYWLSLTPENVDDPSELAALAKKHEVAVELLENQDNHGALRFLREVLEDAVNLEDTNRFLLNAKADLARVLGLVGKFNESFSVYKEIIPLMDATFGETDELTMLCKDTMGQVFLFSGNQFLKRQMSNLKWFLF